MGTVGYADIRTAVSFEESFFKKQILLRASVHHAARISAGNSFNRIAILIKVSFIDGRFSGIRSLIGEFRISILAFFITGSADHLAVFIAIIHNARITGLALDQLHIRAEVAFPLHHIWIQSPQFVPIFIVRANSVVLVFNTCIATHRHGIFIKNVIKRYAIIPFITIVFILYHRVMTRGHGPFTICTKVTDKMNSITATIILICHLGITIDHLH